jgi:hypothetical protein
MRHQRAAEIIADLLLRDQSRCCQQKPPLDRLGCLLVHGACLSAARLMWHRTIRWKAFAVGMTASTMMHIATVRAIHLPMGLCPGRLAICLIVVTSNTLRVERGDWVSMAVSLLLCAWSAWGISYLRLWQATGTAAKPSGLGRGDAGELRETRFRGPTGCDAVECDTWVWDMPNSRDRPIRSPQPDGTAGRLCCVGVLLDDILDLAAVSREGGCRSARAISAILLSASVAVSLQARLPACVLT